MRMKMIYRNENESENENKNDNGNLNGTKQYSN